ncbi:MAG: tetratricopeptide repeat protein [Aromatoleum sp.]|jgi:tetratricopeptide (TPR) repeat protein|uniref:tetratricopeptide repeat protein n=1 Tax=Aromatoleum sp. TaxID=2307007 RepID=UPI0028943F5F|nr:tetratricopeptide repeat protein [Aromatoleum sp.]MDT3670888.1 tetratricopeptide repeat protein [Aromatoleum sp.]
MNRHLSLLTACLGLSVALTVPAFAQTDDAVGEERPTSAAADASLPAQDLTPRVLYTFLLAEIAGARGQIDVSLQAYLDLAQRTRDPRIAKRAVEVALFARDTQAATEAARIWAEAEPESAEARRVLANVLSGGAGELDQVQIQLARLLAQSPEQIENHLMSLNRAFARVPDKAAVKEIIHRLTEPYSDRPEAHFARAQAAIAIDDEMEALAAIETALKLRPDWEPAILFKAQLLAQRDAPDEAIALLKAHLDRNPESRNTRLTYARALVSARQFDAARDQFRALLDAARDDRDLMYAVGLLSAQVEDYDAAVPLLERALDAGHPEADGIRLNLGQIAERRKDPERALQWYRSVEQGRHYLDAQVRIASVLAEQGKLKEAREYLQRIDADADTRKRLRIAEAQLLRTAGHSAEAFALLDEELQRAPDDQDLLYESAMLAEQMGKIDVMESRLRKLIALKPDHAHAYNALGYSLADRGERLEEAESLITRALELTPGDPFILDSMGWVRFRRGNPEEALRHLERAYGMRPDPEIAAHLGEVLWAMKREADAARVWNEALRAHPDNSVLKNVMQRFESR